MSVGQAVHSETSSTPLERNFAFAQGPVVAVRVLGVTKVADNGGDTWVGAWTRAGSLFTPSNDTTGFHDATSANIAFHQLSGDCPSSLSGKTINPMTEYGQWAQAGADGHVWKSTGCAAIDGTLYLFVSRHNYGENSGDTRMRQTAKNASLIRSTDGGRTWVRSAQDNYDRPMFPGPRFATPYFVDYGRDFNTTADGGDRYVYAISNNGFWDNGDNQILGRVLRTKIGNLNPGDWQFYRGGDGVLDTSWSSDMGVATQILQAPAKLGIAGAAYIPARQSYLMIAWYYPGGSAKIPGSEIATTWDFYTATKPWGPWSKVGSHSFSPQGYYNPVVCPKFAAADGKTIHVLTTGNYKDKQLYCLHVVQLQLSGDKEECEPLSEEGRS